MDVLIVIVALALVAGLASAMHGFIKPAVDWLHPQAQGEPLPEPSEPADDEILIRWKDGTAMTYGQSRTLSQEMDAIFNDGSAEKRRKLEQREDKALQRQLEKQARQDAAEDARLERERQRFWREIERIEQNARR